MGTYTRNAKGEQVDADGVVRPSSVKDLDLTNTESHRGPANRIHVYRWVGGKLEGKVAEDDESLQKLLGSGWSRDLKQGDGGEVLPAEPAKAREAPVFEDAPTRGRKSRE